MPLLSYTIRLAATLVACNVLALLAAVQLGVVPDATSALRARREATANAVALACSLGGTRQDPSSIERILDEMVARDSELVAARFRLAGGGSSEMGRQSAAQAGNALSETPAQPYSEVLVPLLVDGKTWGEIRLAFADSPARFPLWHALMQRYPHGNLFAIVIAISLPLQSLMLFWVFQRLQPDHSLSARFQLWFNQLREGVIVIDRSGDIAFANDAFARLVASSQQRLVGQPISQMDWMREHSTQSPATVSAAPFPWDRAMLCRQSILAEVVRRNTADGTTQSLLINAVPLLDARDECQGVIVSADDISEIQARNTALREMLEKLAFSQEQIRLQNEELRHLASRDSLTGCLNRRAFLERFESRFDRAVRFGDAIGCILLDIDHFKLINDQHGHAMGDQVLSHVAEALRTTIRQSDLLCRYGGEEFCILLAGQTIEGTVEAAERIRSSLSTLAVHGKSVTASLGATSMEFRAPNAQRLIQQADEALYAAKRNGRNQVCRWDQLGNQLAAEEISFAQAADALRTDQPTWISYHTVQAIFSLMLLRCLPVAEHCRRVADTCVLASDGLLSSPDVYLVEVAALLHEVGKLGLPDAILLKRRPLTAEDRQIVDFYHRVGRELLRATFDCARLDEAISVVHGARLAAANKPAQLTTVARLLTIADRFDHMAFDRDGRRLLSDELASQQLLQSSDPRLDRRFVEHFVKRIADREGSLVTACQAVPVQPLSEIESNILNELKSIRDQLREREIATESTVRLFSKVSF